MHPRLTFLGNSEQLIHPFTTEGNRTYIPYPCESSTKCSPYLITFNPGLYNISLYGGEGGIARKDETTTFEAGKGGVVSALITFGKRTRVYLYIGGKGVENGAQNKLGGYNGGGSGNEYRGTGGGATDMRYNKDSYESRLIVAGGGGGAYYRFRDGQHLSVTGGDGGGLNGSVGFSSDHGTSWSCFGGQDGCYNINFPNPEYNYVEVKGKFGFGATDPFGAGGGGWYGGGGYEWDSGAGGSSYFGNLLNGKTEGGVNTGNGKAEIDTIECFIGSCKYNHHNHHVFNYIFIFIIAKG